MKKLLQMFEWMNHQNNFVNDKSFSFDKKHPSSLKKFFKLEKNIKSSFFWIHFV